MNYLSGNLAAATAFLAEVLGSGEVDELTMQLLVLKAVKVAHLQSFPLRPGVINPHDAIKVALLALS